MKNSICEKSKITKFQKPSAISKTHLTHEFGPPGANRYRSLVMRIDTFEKWWRTNENGIFEKYEKITKRYGQFREVLFSLRKIVMDILIEKQLYDVFRRKPGWRFTADFGFFYCPEDVEILAKIFLLVDF